MNLQLRRLGEKDEIDGRHTKVTLHQFTCSAKKGEVIQLEANKKRDKCKENETVITRKYCYYALTSWLYFAWRLNLPNESSIGSSIGSVNDDDEGQRTKVQ